MINVDKNEIDEYIEMGDGVAIVYFEPFNA